MEVVASLSQGRTAAAQCGLFTHKSVSVIFETPCTLNKMGVAAEEFCVSPGRNAQKKKNRNPLNANFTGTRYVTTVRCKAV